MSTAVAALISGIISVIVVRLQYNNTLRLNRNNRKWDLSLEVLRHLQDALAKIESSQQAFYPQMKLYLLELKTTMQEIGKNLICTDIKNAIIKYVEVKSDEAGYRKKMEMKYRT